MKEIANFLWIGPNLSRYEEVAIRSFIHNGFEARVWSYSPLRLPEGATPMDAQLILPQEETGRYTQGGKPNNLAAFSDVFRYTLLSTRLGEWWFDTDCICLKDAADFRELKAGKKLVVGQEDQDHVNGACLSFLDRELASALVQEQKRIIEGKRELMWGEIGPRLLTAYLNSHRLSDEIFPPRFFYPIHYSQAVLMNDPSYCEQIMHVTKASFICHLWNDLLATQIDKSAPPKEGSYLEVLLLKYSTR